MTVVVAQVSPLLEKCLCQSRKEGDHSGRTPPGALASFPPPQPRHLGPGPAWPPPRSRDRPPSARTPSGGGSGRLLTAPGGASWLQSQFAAAWARSPASLAHAPAAGVQPHSRSTFSFSCPLFFSLWWQIWVSFLAFLSFFFFFFFCSGRSREEGE